MQNRIFDLLPDFKICPNCGKKLKKEEYFKEIKDKKITNPKRIASLWKKKRFCSYTCSSNFHNKSAKEKHLTEILQDEMKFTAPLEIFNVENGEIKDVVIKIYGKDMIFRKIGEKNE